MTFATIFIANPLITPNVGMMFWTLVTFTILLLVLRKFAWGPIMTGLRTREQSIADALGEAKKAREEMNSLKAENEALLAQARAERDRILKEAKEIKEKMLTEAKTAAQEESKRIMAQAQESIEKEKATAFADLKEQVVTLAIEAASKIVRKELANTQQQEALIEGYLNDVKAN